MNVLADLRAYALRLYKEQPGITVPEAADAILDYLPAHHAGAEMECELKRIGAEQFFRGIYQQIRTSARTQLKKEITQRHTRRETFKQLIMAALLSKIALPEGDQSPTLAECGLLLIERSTAYLRQHLAGTSNQIAFQERAAAQLRLAVARSGNDDLTFGEASALGLIDWEAVVA